MRQVAAFTKWLVLRSGAPSKLCAAGAHPLTQELLLSEQEPSFKTSEFGNFKLFAKSAWSHGSERAQIPLQFSLH